MALLFNAFLLVAMGQALDFTFFDREYYKMPAACAGTANGVFDGYFYMFAGCSNSLLRTPISSDHPNYTQWDITTYTISDLAGSVYHCYPNCGVVFPSKKKMYTVGRHHSFGNGENWDQLYRSYEIDLTPPFTLTKVNWDSTDGFTQVTKACITSDGIDTIFVVGGLNRTSHPQYLLQYFNVNVERWYTRKIDLTSVQGFCTFYRGAIYVFPEGPGEGGSLNLYFVRKINVSNVHIQSTLNSVVIGDIREFMQVSPTHTELPSQHKGRSTGFAVYSAVDHKIYFGTGLKPGSPDIFYNDVYSIDVLRNDTIELVGYLDIGLSATAAIAADASIELFGGITGNNIDNTASARVDTIIHATIPTASPTTGAPTSLQSTVVPSQERSDSSWVLKENGRFNCNDGFEEASDPSYCQPCLDGYVGTSGQCHTKCDWGYEPNDSRTECEISTAIDVIIIVCTIGPVLAAVATTIYAKRHRMWCFKSPQDV